MSLKYVFGVLVLIHLTMCDDNDFPIMNLTNDGTSSPIQLMSEESENVGNIAERSITDLADTINPTTVFPTITPSADMDTITMHTNDSIETASFTKTMVSTTPPQDTTIITTTSSTIPTTAAAQSTTPDSGDPTVITPSTTNETKPCHESCRKDVAAIHLYSRQTKRTLPVGSNLTLVCELPLTANFTLENIVWLYEAKRTPECSLTTQEFLTSCTGFRVIHNKDDRNETFLRETLDLIGLTHNNTGRFICQAEVTCCGKSSDQNLMVKQQHLDVKIWHSDYTLDLAVMGSVAAVLTLAVATVSFFISRQRRRSRSNAYVAIEDRIIQVKPTNVLHMPLVQYDEDNESFDSNFDD